MTARCILVDNDGEISKVFSGDPSMFFCQIEDGFTLYHLTDDNGEMIDNRRIKVDRRGNFAFKSDFPHDELFMPKATLHYISGA